MPLTEEFIGMEKIMYVYVCVFVGVYLDVSGRVQMYK